MVTGDDAMDIIFKTTFSVYIIAVFEKKYVLDILKSFVSIYKKWILRYTRLSSLYHVIRDLNANFVLC